MILKIKVLQTAFPYDKHSPTKLLQLILDSGITGHVGLELLLPELRPRLRAGGVETLFMSMPETAVYEDDE